MKRGLKCQAHDPILVVYPYEINLFVYNVAKSSYRYKLILLHIILPTEMCGSKRVGFFRVREIHCKSRKFKIKKIILW